MKLPDLSICELVDLFDERMTGNIFSEGYQDQHQDCPFNFYHSLKILVILGFSFIIIQVNIEI